VATQRKVWRISLENRPTHCMCQMRSTTALVQPTRLCYYLERTVPGSGIARTCTCSSQWL